MDQTLEQKVHYWAGQVALGRPLAFVPDHYRGLVAAQVGRGGRGVARLAGTVHGVRTLARVSRFMDPATGASHFVFETPRGTVYQPETQALRAALSGLRIGELVVDDTVARKILDKFEEMDRWVRAAEDARRSNPRQAETSGLSASIDGYWAGFDKERTVLDVLKAKANKALLIRTWQSAPDKDLETLDVYHGIARELFERSKDTAPPKPAPPARPPAPRGDDMGTLTKIAIGLGATSVLIGGGILVYNLTRRS